MAIPPVTLNLLQLLPGDDQTVHTDKINFNFDQILSLGGGPPGLTGAIGGQGLPGAQGLQGFMGTPGTPGSHWYVQNTVPTVSPSPNVGDYWFHTDTLDIRQWDGTTWAPIGVLTIAGVFKNSIGDPDRVLFTNPTPLKSLVLSPIDYGVGAPQSGAYKLKLIGTSGSNIMNFGVLETGNTENTAALQSYISVSTITPSTTYGFSVVNPSGPIEVNAPGTTLKFVEQAGGVSQFEFNGLSLKLQINPTDRNLGFSPSIGSNLGFHIGRQDALSTATSRGLSVYDLTAGFKVSLRGAHSVPLATDGANYPGGIFFDSLHKQLGGPVASTQLWMRNRGYISGANQGFVNIETSRTFDDTGNGVNPWRSVDMAIQSGIDADKWHGIHFAGGAKDGTEDSRPMLKFTIPGGNYPATAMDTNGYWGFGSNTFLIDNNSTVVTTRQFKTNINIEGQSGAVSTGLTAFGGMHFTPQNASANTDRVMGVTAGLTDSGEAVSRTHAGMFFKRYNLGLSMGLEFASGSAGVVSGTPGARTRQSILANGEIHMHGINNLGATAKNYLLKYVLDNTISGVGEIFAHDSLAHGGVGMFKDIILQSGSSQFTDASNTAFKGGGFLGVGSMSSFLSNKPQTKFHVYGPTTFGGRVPIGTYEIDVTPTASYNNWTFGFSHKANASNALILGGNGNIVLDPVQNVQVIGSVNGASTTISNALSSDMVIIPSFSFQTTANNFSSTGVQNPLKDGLYEFNYTASSGTNAIYRFGANSASARTTSRISFTTTSGTNSASNGMDLILNTAVGGVVLPGPTPNFSVPNAKGYYLQCIAHTYNATFGSISDATAFIVTGRNKVGIGGMPRYIPNDSNYLDINPFLWPTASNTSQGARWVPNDNATLQIFAADSNENNGAAIILNNGALGSSSTTGAGATGTAITLRSSRNNYKDATWNIKSAAIGTPNTIWEGSQGRRVAAAPLLVEPGLNYSRPDNQAFQRIHGTTMYIKGGDAGTSSDEVQVVRGGDVVLHGGRAWFENNKNSEFNSKIGNNNDNDTGYGNVSLAYDWTTGNSAGSVSIGVGTPIMANYVGKFTVTRTSGVAGTATGLLGKDFRGQNMTASAPSGNANTLNVTITLPTAFPNNNIACICNVDGNAGNDYKYQVMCVGRTLTTLTFAVVWVDSTWRLVSDWPIGDATSVSFTAYCLPN